MAISPYNEEQQEPIDSLRQASKDSPTLFSENIKKGYPWYVRLELVSVRFIM